MPVSDESGHDIVGPENLQQFVGIVNVRSFTAEPVVQEDEHGCAPLQLAQVGCEPRELCSIEMSPVLKDDRAVEEDEVAARVVERPVERAAGAFEGFLPQGGPSNVVVTRDGIHGQARACDGLRIGFKLRGPAQLGHIAGIHDKRRRRRGILFAFQQLDDRINVLADGDMRISDVQEPERRRS